MSSKGRSGKGKKGQGVDEKSHQDLSDLGNPEEWVTVERVKKRPPPRTSVEGNAKTDAKNNSSTKLESIQNGNEERVKSKNVMGKSIPGTSTKSAEETAGNNEEKAFPPLSSSVAKGIDSGLKQKPVEPPVFTATTVLAKQKTTEVQTENPAKLGTTHSTSNDASRSRSAKPSSSTSSDIKAKNQTVAPKKRETKTKLISNQSELCDIVESRQKIGNVLQSKQGTQGKQAEFVANYYPLIKLTNFNLFHYHVECKPGEERTDVRKKMLQIHETTLGSIIFDGQGLYTPRRIAIKFLYSLNPSNFIKTQICLKLVAEIRPSEPVFLQVYNIMFRNMMSILHMEPINRFYFDPRNKTLIPSRKLEVWPGYITSVRNHENQILLNVEITHKVIRSDSVLDYIKSIQNTARGDYKREVSKLLLGTIVITSYNKKTYKIDDIKWDASPKDSFDCKNGTKFSFLEYYKAQYGCIIKDMNQPMLVSLPKKKDFHRGSTQSIFLVPEICQMTGLTDMMRRDAQLMKDLVGHLAMTPEGRMKAGNDFIKRWYATPKIVQELQNWNVELRKEPMKCKGRIIDMDELIVAPQLGSGGRKGINDGVKVKQDKPGDWTNIFRSKGMLSTVDLRKWVLITPPQNDSVVAQMLLSLKSSSRQMNFIISEPLSTYKMTDLKPTSYVAAIQNLFTHYKGDIQMFFVVLPNSNAEVYSAIKKKTYCELGVACQCVIVKTLMTKNLPTISARLGIQMNAKLGGVPWGVSIPLKEIMIVGYDVFHSPNKRVSSAGALVASTSQNMARYFTSTCYHNNQSELSANLCSQMTNALRTYKRWNDDVLPARIILYRDGVGDGQLSYIYNIELAQIKEAIQTVYACNKQKPPKFSFIVVTKRIHTRIFYPGLVNNLLINPPPGTVVDDVITLPERYDFFLVAQQVTGTGTVSPTSYNVLYDEQGLDADKMQRLTLKLCHLYYNFTGTIAVPAPCQFAHKLAYLTGTSLNTEAHQKLQNYLYFL